VYWSPNTGARLLSGAVYDAWARTGWERGSLGLPVSDLGTTPDGQAQYAHFQRGSVYATTAFGTHVLPADVVTVWARSGWEHGPLGYPTSTPPDGIATDGAPAGAVVQPFQGGVVFATAATGAHVVSGEFGTAFTAAGGPAVLGLPTSDVRTTPDGAGRYQHFTRGSVYSSPATGTHVLRDAVLDAWARTGWERGVLGYPTSDVTTAADGQGLYAVFQHGSIYWSRATGAHVLRGAVYQAWTGAGADQGVLGYPTTDVTATPDGKGHYAYFQGGAVYTSTVGGTHVLRGALLDAWAGTGWERGALGWPTSDLQAVTGGSRMTFQHGSITVSTATGAATVQLR
jgi:uncharacterized protein with LGFP repeats